MHRLRTRCALLCMLIVIASAIGCDKTSSLESFQLRQGQGLSLSQDLSGQITAIRFDSSPLTDADLQVMGTSTSLRELSGNAEQVTEAGLVALAGCSGLQSLQLNSCRLNAGAARAISSLSALTVLNLTDAKELAPAHLSCFAELPKLLELGLSGTAMNDSCIAQLPAAPLRALSLSRTQLTGAGVQMLAEKYPALEVIQLDEVALDAAAVAAIAQLQKVTNLSLCGCGLDDASAAPLSGLKQLRVLNISSNAAITDALIQSLGTATELRTLNVSGTQFTGTAFADAGFPGLSSLIADNTMVKGDSLRSLKLPTLFSLSLNGCSLSMAEIRKVFAANDQTAVSFEEVRPAEDAGEKVKGQI
ncbi:MAG: hypothetical protein ACKOEO_09270 [Planctomycetaceae bacterium]